MVLKIAHAYNFRNWVVALRKKKKKKKKAGQWWRTPLIPALGRQRQRQADF
jgi:hypothetical protein